MKGGVRMAESKSKSQKILVSVAGVDHEVTDGSGKAKEGDLVSLKGDEHDGKLYKVTGVGTVKANVLGTSVDKVYDSEPYAEGVDAITE
jgi:hypothetical protein